MTEFHHQRQIHRLSDHIRSHLCTITQTYIEKLDPDRSTQLPNEGIKVNKKWVRSNKYVGPINGPYYFKGGVLSN